MLIGQIDVRAMLEAFLYVKCLVHKCVRVCARARERECVRVYMLVLICVCLLTYVCVYTDSRARACVFELLQPIGHKCRWLIYEPDCLLRNAKQNLGEIEVRVEQQLCTRT